MKLPSGLNTWMRSLTRSQTYSRLSCVSSAQCTGLRNCCSGRRVGIVRARVGIVGLVPIGAPVPLVFAGIRVEHDHAMVPVTIGDVQFVGLGIDKRLGGPAQILDVITAFAASGFADLHQELSVLREFQHHIVVVALKRRWTPLCSRAASSGRRFVIGAIDCASTAGCGPLAVAADPHVAFVVHRDSVIGVGPIVALARSAPMTQASSRLRSNSSTGGAGAQHCAV